VVFHVFGAIAHFEQRLIAERTKDGIAAARAGRRPLDADKSAAGKPVTVAAAQAYGCSIKYKRT
jgi:DNA invertase Pin-like site-specific DNA recombinase